MSHTNPFLQAILDNPDDDTPRLVYADWLDENGDPERAELIRIQCEEAKLDAGNPRLGELMSRGMDLLSANGKRWMRDLPKLAQRYCQPGFDRGFVTGLCCTVTQFLMCVCLPRYSSICSAR